MKIYDTHFNQRKAGTPIFVSDKVDFRVMTNQRQSVTLCM